MENNTINLKVTSIATTGEEKGQQFIFNIELEENTLKGLLKARNKIEKILNIAKEELSKKIDNFKKQCNYTVNSIVFFNPIKNRMSFIDTDKLD